MHACHGICGTTLAHLLLLAVIAPGVASVVLSRERRGKVRVAGTPPDPMQAIFASVPAFGRQRARTEARAWA